MYKSLRQLADEGVAVWLDDLSRSRLRSGHLAELVRSHGVRGVTTNPSIFHAAITNGSAYDDQFGDFAGLGLSPTESVRLATCHDVRAACDVLRPVHAASDGLDGWVSIEVDPRLAHDPTATLAEARLLRWLVDRPNVLIKIPATVDCLPAISACLAEGISVNVTLIFSVQRYESVAEAFLAGMEAAHGAGIDLDEIASVASFFVSRMDTEVDGRLDLVGTKQAHALRGHAAIANARLAYEHYERVFSSPRWRVLERAGARAQRLLWASTGVKDPAYDDTRYVTDLVAPGTVNTMPEATLDAVADHGVIRGDRVSGTCAEARQVFEELAALGIDYTEVVTTLEHEGVAKFRQSWQALLDEVEVVLARPGVRAASAVVRGADVQIGMIGAGRMGANLVRRLMRAGHRVVVYDPDPAAVTALVAEGAVAASSPRELVACLERPASVWVMVPAAVTGTVVEQVAAVMDAADVIVDGGNSHYLESARRAAALAERGIHLLDVGTSGGVHGLDRGYCLMIGGDERAVKRLAPVFAALAPGVDVAPRTSGAQGAPTAAEQGYLHCGPAGAGHFVKMVHNGIEYGQMAALAEGLAILRGANTGAQSRDVDAETAPLAESAAYRYDFDIAEIAEVWRRGSVIGSWLLDLTAAALRADPDLSGYSGRVSDSGEGRWVVRAAVDEGVPAYVLTAALFERFSSRRGGEYADKVLSAMRHAFGGHHEKDTTS